VKSVACVQFSLASVWPDSCCSVGSATNKFERLECLTEHSGILLSVVPKPSLPKRKGPYAIIWHCGFAIGDDVFDVLTRTQLHATSKELLRGYRSNACLLVVTRLPRDAFAHDKFPDVHFAIRQAVFVVREHPACELKLLQIGIVIVGFREDGEHFVLHSIKQRRSVVASAFKPSDF